MTREQWLINLKEGTGIFDAATLETLEPDPEMIALAREIITLPWVENLEDEFQRLETSALMYLAFVEDVASIHDVLTAILEAERIHQGWIPDISGELLRGFGMVGFAAIKAKIAELEQNTKKLVESSPESFWYYFYWGLIIGLTYIVKDHPELEPEFRALVLAHLEHPEFPEELTELWVGSADKLQDITELEPDIKAFFAKNPNSAKHGFTDWLKDRQKSLKQKLPSSREQMAEFLADVHTDYLEQIELNLQQQEQLARVAKKPVENKQFIAPSHYGARVSLVAKIGRNDPCPCGSGKKFKQCHGKNGETRYSPESRV
jgi:SEC-C motif